MKKIKNIIWVAFLGYFIYKVALNSFTDNFLGDEPQITKAIIVDEKNYMENQPVKPRFSYSYSFTVNSKEYRGNSHDTTLAVGDTVEVKYNKEHPGINKPLHPKE
ncbi:hypothetical protein EWM62_17315 [Mucilaginibacter terrigena]|uniref:DUF3592 domain-containing protein n=1 Tax=Mucilaginibacter terrigena TaxID=2492395 RepID=A0A4Q5LHT3_9SPHI|nr:hypothetical protein [Mucilaginibacter terrigena]RYU86909.1 hypothetical protein EWM62_17315 [Mucilaginibacter terrigena]